MMKRLFLYIVIFTAALFVASCSDNDSFTTNRSDILSFSTDTVRMDTVFSTVPTSTYTFWVRNNSSDGLRLRQVRLQRGNQTGFRVNVDGTYLDNSMGSVVSGLEIRKGDSIRVFVELTSAMNDAEEPQLVEDNLVFSLESGVEQKVNLCAYSWDALLYDNVVISKDSTISGTKPIVIRGGLKVDSLATLTINAPATVYFHSGAGIDVYGRLIINGNNGDDVVLRGDRTDRMFDYLPYDRVSGQWKGIHIHPSSTGNSFTFADIHSADSAIVCDSAAFDEATKRLSLNYVTVHNCKGSGVAAYNSNIEMANCQITNTLGDCLAVYGGRALVVYCTFAQFYPFEGDRGVAMRFTNYIGDYDNPLHMLECYNSLITGYSEDEIMGETKDSTVTFAYHFENCIIRTPKPKELEGDDAKPSEKFVNIVFETPKDTIQGTQHFIKVDADNQYYDFHLDSLSTARGKAFPTDLYPLDRDGVLRGATPDIGCYQYRPKE